MKHLLKDIPDEHKRGWTLTIDGKEVTAKHLTLTHPLFGMFEYGMRNGFDGFLYHEHHGGGSVIVPYAIIAEELFIGLVLEEREAVGGKDWNVPRGMIDPKETHFEAAVRETKEETGIDVKNRLFALPGSPVNPNNTFFVTLDQEGVQYFGFEVKPEELKKSGPNMYVFNDKKNQPVSKVGERIFGCVFRRWNEVVAFRDLFSVCGTARLMLYLKTSDKMFEGMIHTK